MAGVPDIPRQQFVLFDALGLEPTAGIISREDVTAAWRRVKKLLHSRRAANNNGFLPAFPTFAQARDAYRYLTAHGVANEEKEASRRITQHLRTGRAAFRSTWNPAATPGTAEILLPIPGAPTVETAGPAPPLATRHVGPEITPPRSDGAGEDGNGAGRQLRVLGRRPSQLLLSRQNKLSLACTHLKTPPLIHPSVTAPQFRHLLQRAPGRRLFFWRSPFRKFLLV
ncbi:hypothetical protein MMC26_000814 [Xylographa opegraphella]|nr:hypothetical protein [Xylographa opegraphella]